MAVGATLAGNYATLGLGARPEPTMSTVFECWTITAGLLTAFGDDAGGRASAYGPLELRSTLGAWPHRGRRCQNRRVNPETLSR